VVKKRNATKKPMIPPFVFYFLLASKTTGITVPRRKLDLNLKSKPRGEHSFRSGERQPGNITWARSYTRLVYK
ncbi:MAG: hypothetical protein Q8P44_00075, partial [Dehalococcoidia bacterium]|nr:hypothetical protein [Dehalococcoidia bacterium]